MSKLKVSIYHTIKSFFVPSKPRKQLYIFSMFKSLKFYPFVKRDDRVDDKIKKYFNHLTIPEIITQADKLYEQEKYLEVYELLDRIRMVNDPEVLWRIARVLYNLNLGKGLQKETRSSMIDEALFVLHIAFGNGGSNNAEVHKWLAVILDTHYGLVSLENKVKFSPLVRDHLIRACELNPKDFSVHFMLGKWCYQMCCLSWFQRIIAKYFIASEPPKSCYSTAYKYLLKAEELQPRTVLSNLYLLGKTCVEIGQFFKAKYYLNLAVNLRPKDDGEKSVASKAKSLMRKLDRYDLGKNVLFYDPLGFNDGI